MHKLSVLAILLLALVAALVSAQFQLEPVEFDVTAGNNSSSIEFFRPRFIAKAFLPAPSPDDSGASVEHLIVAQQNGKIVAAPLKGSNNSSSGSAGGASSGSAASGNVTIEALSMSFSPAKITIKAGSCVTWTDLNNGHNVVQVASKTSEEASANGFTSGSPNQVESFTHCFAEPGDYFFICQVHVHAGMRGQVTVVREEPSTPALIDILDIYSNETRNDEIANENNGLISMALHTDFSSNGRFWVMHSHLCSVQGSEAEDALCTPSDDPLFANFDHVVIVDEYHYNSSSMKADYARRVISLAFPFSNHNGRNNLYFDNDKNRLLIAVGDGGDSNDPLFLSLRRDSLLGKIISIGMDDTDHSICNRTLTSMDEAEEYCKEEFDRHVSIVAMGIRDPTGMALFKRASGGDSSSDSANNVTLILSDHGLNVDEVHRADLMSSSANSNSSMLVFGWNFEEGGKCLAINASSSADAIANITDGVSGNFTSWLPVALFNGTSTNDSYRLIGSSFLINGSFYYLVRENSSSAADNSSGAAVASPKLELFFYNVSSSGDNSSPQTIDLFQCINNNSGDNASASISELDMIEVSSSSNTFQSMKAHALGTDLNNKSMLFVAIGDSSSADGGDNARIFMIKQ